MPTRLEVFADITCPFTHVGLKRVVHELVAPAHQVEIVVRAWPLEWVNGSPLEAPAVTAKIAALKQQLATNDFADFNEDGWPATTIPALNLAAAAFDVDRATGLAVSLALRNALFEQGRNLGDIEVLSSIASQFHLDAPSTEANASVLADYEDGKRRGVRGSPDFWLGDEEFFCPALTLGHDQDGLTAKFDTEGFGDFMDHVRASAETV